MTNRASRIGIGLKMSASEIDEAGEMRLGGATWCQVARCFGVSAQTASRTVRRYVPRTRKMVPA
mgnify:CR=1 FL=1